VLDQRGQIIRAIAFADEVLMRLIELGLALSLTFTPLAVEAQQGREDAPERSLRERHET